MLRTKSNGNQPFARRIRERGGGPARRVLAAAFAVATAFTAACSEDNSVSWHIVQQDLPGALLSVWGASATDVWAVGADAGSGPTVMHFDGANWETLPTGQTGDLWWVTGFDDGTLYMGGEGGMILRYAAGTFTRMTTPGTGVVFGLWGESPADMWAVGGGVGGSSGAFAWRRQGDEWVAAADFPAGLVDTDALWKVHGRAPNDVWMVGTQGLALHWDGTTLAQENMATGESMFTLHASDDRFVAVGGFGTGKIFENDGSGWQDVSPAGGEPLIGVSMTNDIGFAVGQFGTVLRRSAGAWQVEPTGLDVFEGLHAVWIDPLGGVWAVGGQVQAFPLVRGVMIYRGEHAPGSAGE